jgi:hypothetical protein
MFLWLYRSKVHYFRKHHGRAAGRAYKLLLLAAATGRLALSPLAWLARPPRRTRLLALAAHYGRLVRALPRL